MSEEKHPRDQFITVFGRKPVLEVLEMEDIQVDKVLLDQKSKGEFVKEIIEQCQKREIALIRSTAAEVSKISKNPNQDQGVVVDVIAPKVDHVKNYFSKSKHKATEAWIALDGVTTPANVGMIIRTATALGLGVILPLKGSSKINPLVVKASAGVIFKSHLLKCNHIKEALELAIGAGFQIYGLDSDKGSSIYTTELRKNAIFVLGNETSGVSENNNFLIHRWLRIPMFADVESLNVACAATIVASEFTRRVI
jgi:23S rRNA (guanosine2251-2'-O)-methyltransferase